MCHHDLHYITLHYSRVVYKSQQPTKFAGFSIRFHALLSLLHKSRCVEEMMFIKSKLLGLDKNKNLQSLSFLRLSEEKNPFNRNNVFTPLVHSRKITCLIWDYSLQNCEYINNILEKDFCSFYFLIVSNFYSCNSLPSCMQSLLSVD